MSRTTIVGGVGPTLGESIARRFALAEDSVALWARNTEYTNELATELTENTPGEARAFEVDVTDSDSVTDAVRRVRDAFGSVDVYVHNTAVDAWEGPVTDAPSDLLQTIKTLQYGPVLVVDELLDDLRDGGTVIHNSGDESKWVSRRMAEQLASEGVHVVNTTVDGWIDSPSVPDDVPADERVNPDTLATEYLRLVEQDPSVWTFDVDFRPAGDDGFRTWNP